MGPAGERAHRLDRRPSRTSACCSRATRRPRSCSGWAARALSTNAAKQTTQSIARLLTAAGVDFAVLGPRERCTGDPARRMGHEYLFQMLAEQNVETLNGAGVTKIVASCAHCFNTLANEYPDYGGTYEVVHHTELLSALVAEGRLAPTPAGDGGSRHLPRRVLPRPAQRALRRAARRARRRRRRSRSRCLGTASAPSAAAPAARGCGWRRPKDTRINDTRFAEAAATGADTVATACPYCFVMLDDAAKAAGSEVRVADVATLLAEATLSGADRLSGITLAGMEPILLVRCDAFETYGVAPSALGAAGATTRIWDATDPAEERPNLGDVSGVVLFGSTSNVEQADERPFIKRSPI